MHRFYYAGNIAMRYFRSVKKVDRLNTIGRANFFICLNLSKNNEKSTLVHLWKCQKSSKMLRIIVNMAIILPTMIK